MNNIYCYSHEHTHEYTDRIHMSIEKMTPSIIKMEYYKIIINTSQQEYTTRLTE